MRIANGIAYSDEERIKVKSIRPVGGHELLLRFSDNSEKKFDFSPLLDMPCFIPLRDQKLFETVYVDFGIPMWNDGEIDISPDKLYQDGVSV